MFHFTFLFVSLLIIAARGGSYCTMCLSSCTSFSCAAVLVGGGGNVRYKGLVTARGIADLCALCWWITFDIMGW